MHQARAATHLAWKANNAQNRSLSVHRNCVFVIMRGFWILDNVPQHLQSTEMQHVCACARVCVCGPKVEEVNPSGHLLRWDTVGARGHYKERGGGKPHLRMNLRLVRDGPARDRGGWDLSLNIRLWGLRQMIGISSALPTTSDCLSLYLLSVLLVPPVPPN